MTPEQNAEFWSENRRDGPSLWRVAAVVGVFGSLLALAADVQNLATEFAWPGLLLRLSNVLFFLVTGVLAWVRPGWIERAAVGLQVATIYIVCGTVVLLSPNAEGIHNLYFIGILQVELAAAAFFTIPRRAFWAGACIANASYLTVHWRDVAGSPFATTLVSTLAIFLLIAGASQHVVLSYKEKAFLQRKLIAASEERIATVLRRITDAFFALDREWRFVYFNPEAERLLGRMQQTREQLYGQVIWSAFPNLVGDSLMHQQFLRAVEHGVSVDFEEYYPLMDAHLEVHAFPSPDGLSVYCHEISDRKRAEAALNQAMEQLESRVAERTKELRDLMARLTDIREAERARISAEIHDELGQILSVLAMELSWIERQPGAERLAERVLEMRKLVVLAVASVRRIAADLRPGVLDDLGLAAAIEWVVESTVRRAGLRTEVHIDPEEIEIESDMATAVFRIVQEGMTNIVRHAQATEARVDVRADGRMVRIDITDDGVGLLESPKRDRGAGGLGLVSMRERAEQYRGSMVVTSAPGKGTRIHVEMPLLDGVAAGQPSPGGHA